MAGGTDTNVGKWGHTGLKPHTHFQGCNQISRGGEEALGWWLELVRPNREDFLLFPATQRWFLS